MLTIWGRKTSSNVQALMWCVGELGLAYERHDVGHKYGGNDTGAFLQMNPNGTVPVLRDGEGLVAAVCQSWGHLTNVRQNGGYLTGHGVDDRPRVSCCRGRRGSPCWDL